MKFLYLVDRYLYHCQNLFFALAIFISFLFNKGNSLSITFATIFIFLWPIFACIVADFSDLKEFPSLTVF